jgi:hypothetical protein
VKSLDYGIESAWKTMNNNKNGILFVYKSTRAGATTGLCAESSNRNEPFVIIVPTNAIADETVGKEAIEYFDKKNINLVHVVSNQMCLRNQNMCDEFPNLTQLPFLPLAGNCERCQEYACCVVTRVMREDNIDGVSLTYQKLTALAMSGIFGRGEYAKHVIEKLLTFHNFIFDECHELEYGKNSKITLYCDKKGKLVFADKYGSVPDKFKNIKQIIDGVHYFSIRMKAISTSIL